MTQHIARHPAPRTDPHTPVRPAGEHDIAELVRLRALLFETLDGDFFTASSTGDDWRHSLATVLKEQLATDTVRILVVDGVDSLAACGFGFVEQRLPGPNRPNGLSGHVTGVVTDPAFRRRGHSRAIMRGLLDWFREREVPRVDLYASHDGEPLYRALGFVPHPDPALCGRP
ncbi:GNAT family N-acetyltransferase [Streptomyces kanamyceticus]|uniref:N-acetyltransferase n=1 Tax=Streptomyces kanamyceticus TaxID=1967 RepID=A0A5J6GU47_STRKN|nr:GNAT family N-acetyltransferase [Streptomyces kanamyceticus]QEU96576.1 N-acetyltransferase [Streptomyces kanamyceticus]